MKYIKVGHFIPEFSSVLENGKQFESNKQLGNKWVLYFYPKDLTPGCINQACNIKENFKLLEKKKIKIFGISMDNEKMHQRFIHKYQLPFHLLADTDKKVIDMFGVWGEKKFMGKIYDGIHRTTFLMDEKNKVVGIIDKPKTKDHVSEILAIYASI